MKIETPKLARMKHPLLLFVALFLSINSFAQTIAVDRLEYDGRRQIMADGIKMQFDGAEYNISLKVFTDAYSTDWLLLISSFYYIPDNAVVLLKLRNDEVMEFPINNLNIGSVTVPGYSTQIGSVITSSPSRQQDYYSSVYVITPEEMDTIQSVGVKKIRISSTAYHEYRENTLGVFRIGGYIKSARAAIERRMSKPLNKSRIWDNF